MSRFDLIFTGELIDGCEPAQVRRDLERLFKTDAAAISRLFTGMPVVIKKDIDEQTAKRYRAALQQVGALCQVRPAAGTDAQEGAAGQGVTTVAPASSLTSAAILPPGSILTESRMIAPPAFDFTGLSVAPPGETLVERAQLAPAPPPAPGAYQVAPAGTDLVEPRRITPAPLPDISALTMAPPGTTVLTADERDRPPPPPPPDPGDLSLAD